MVSNQVAGVALLSKSGREVLLGQLRGTITLYDTASQQVLDVVKVRQCWRVDVVAAKGMYSGCSAAVCRMSTGSSAAAAERLYHSVSQQVLAVEDVTGVGWLVVLLQ
jgi:hypothetical protein